MTVRRWMEGLLRLAGIYFRYFIRIISISISISCICILIPLLLPLCYIVIIFVIIIIIIIVVPLYYILHVIYMWNAFHVTHDELQVIKNDI